LTKTGGGGTNDDQNEGVVKTYDFGVTFKSTYPGGEREPRGEGNAMEPRKDRRHGGQNRKQFGEDEAADDDDGFKIVRNVKDKKRKRHDDSSSDDDQGTKNFSSGRMQGGARVEQRGTRGSRGGYPG